jgi:polysaccharide biosynthesis protein PslH
VKVLVVCPFVPWPLDSGGRIRTFHLVHALASAEHAGTQVELWCVADQRDPGPLERELERAIPHTRLFPRSTASTFQRLARAKVERWFASTALHDALVERFRSAPPDLVHVDEMSVLRSVPDAPCPLLVHHSKLDVEFHALAHGDGAAARFDRAKLRRLEDLAAKRARHHVVCSPGDRELLLARHPRLQVTAVPSGFDPDYFAPNACGAVEREPDTLLMLGSLDYEPNVDGLEYWVDAIGPLVPASTCLRVVGRNPTPRVHAACARARERGARIELVGEVDDVRPELARARALVVPLRIGGGTRLKIAEALAMRTPVISTSIGAEGLDLGPQHLDLADSPEAFAKAVRRLGDDPRGTNVRVDAGHREVEQNLAWPQLAARLRSAWQGAIG